MPKVSILIPVYNAKDTLPQCLKSLNAITYTALEVVLVDDCSDDGSKELLESYIANTDKTVEVKLIRHDKNQGVAAARNTLLENATGKYLCFLDADDRIEETAIDELVNVAETQNADIVGFDWYLSFPQNERYMAQRPFSTPLDALKNMMCGVMRWNLWMFMTKRSLYSENGIRFVPGLNMGEDMYVTICLFLKAEKVYHVKKAYYHYCQANVSSVSRQFTEKLIGEVTENVIRAEVALSESVYADELAVYINYLKQFVKFPLLMSSEKSQYERWNSWFPESNAYILDTPMLPYRTKLLEYAASREWYLLIKGYYLFIYKFVYGIIFK